ncbi:MAG: hypothetical protein ACQERB_05395 [Promethearchaeati archaeon]
MKNISKTIQKYTLNLKKYPNGQLAVFIKDEDGFPIAEISILADSIDLNENEFIYKDYSEYNNLSQELLDSNVIKPTNRFVIIGSHLCPICVIPS